MLNENMTFEKKEAKQFPLLKNDIYQAQLIDVNIEKKTKYQSEELEEMLSFEFAVLGGKDIEGGEARTRLLAKNFVPTFLYISSKKGKNWLYKLVEALIGRDLTKEEEANGITSTTLNYLIDKQCRLILEKVPNKNNPGRFYSNITNILPSDTDFSPLTQAEKEEIDNYKASKKAKQPTTNTPEEDYQPSQHLSSEELAAIEGQDMPIASIPF